MATQDPTWDDTGFDDQPDDGFMASATPTPTPTPSPEPEAVPAPPTPPPPASKKGKGALFWFGVLSAVVLIVALIGGGIYWLTLPTAEEEAFFAKEGSIPASVVDSAVTVPPAEDLAVTDTTIVHEAEALEALFGDSAADAVEPTPKIDVKPTPKVDVKPTPKVDVKPTPKADVKPTPKADVKPAAKASGQLFVVQVFSSPSRDDAEEWVQSLRAKNVSDAYVTEQKIKGESWYRVRFGQFSTREQAESEALRLGFREPWIARIR